MLPESFVVMIVICAIVFPAIVYFVLRRRAGLASLPLRWWLSLYGVAFIFQPIFLVRKHLEVVIYKSNPTLTGALLTQVDNAWWEELAKLLAIVLVVWLARDQLKPLLQKLPAAIGLSYWAGLAYGIGEAVMLAILFIAPQLDPIFGVNTFTPFPLGWAYVYERFWAMQLHGIMGALIGIGLWRWVNGRRWSLVGWFIAAMLYHDLVDGPILLASAVPAVATLIQNLGLWFVVILAAIGYALIAVIYFILKRLASSPTVPAA